MPRPSWTSIASGSSKRPLLHLGCFLSLGGLGCGPCFEKVLTPQEVSLIYISRSAKAPKRKLQSNGPVSTKAKKETSSSDSSEDSSEEEEDAPGPPAKKAGKAVLGR